MMLKILGLIGLILLIIVMFYIWPQAVNVSGNDIRPTPTAPCPTPFSDHCFVNYTPVPTIDDGFELPPTIDPYPGPRKVKIDLIRYWLPIVKR